jgi:NADPH-dependent glutamate synthase beta subunit-like oxidoreductase
MPDFKPRWRDMAGCKPFSVDLSADQSGLPHYVPPPCQVACPIGTDVGSYVGLIWQGDKSGALEAITATNPLSGICGRVCDAPCEPACRRANSDGPVAIRALKRWVLDALGPEFRPEAVKPDKDMTVAIIGAGPAGLTAAQDIALAGYKVEIFEALPKPGGMAVWGIPDFRLLPNVVEDDINRILTRCPGIKLHLSAPLGEAIDLLALTHRFDAVLLAIGASAGKSLNVPGDDAPCVVDGVSFLNRISGGDRPVLPRHVVVVGGGDVAMDACRTAKRLPGVEKVTVIYRRGEAEIPARKYEREAALAEGIEIVYNVAPVEILAHGDAAATVRCKRTTLGEPGADGRRSFALVEGSDFDISAGLVVAAVGQKTVSLELAKYGLLDGDKIATDAATMQTRLEKVYAAGDAAFGSSTIVQAMFQGHKSAYYILAALEGNANPVPYRTPYRTRATAVAQDPEWEILARAEPEFQGFKNGAFGDAEANFDDRTAKEQAARCYRCDTETGSADYTVKTREAIFALARLDATPADYARITRERLAMRAHESGDGRATLDELVFLPANLTRLVIDPYRESCKTATELGEGLSLSHPMLVSGFENAPVAVREAVAGALAASGGAYVGRTSLGDERVPWLQVLDPGSPAHPKAVGAVLRLGQSAPVAPVATRDGQLRGLVVTAQNVDMLVPFAVEQKLDLLLLDGTSHFGGEWADLSGAPDLSLLTRTVKCLRALKAEETITVLWFGGLRSGSDMAKALSLGAVAGIGEVAVAIAAGGEITASGIAFPSPSGKTAEEGVAAFLKAAVSEASMMARCTGKTNVHNLEPEDLRTTSIRAAKATGIVMAGVRHVA